VEGVVTWEAPLRKVTMADCTCEIMLSASGKNPQSRGDGFTPKGQAPRNSPIRFAGTLALALLIPLLPQVVGAQETEDNAGFADHRSGEFLYVANFANANVLTGLEIHKRTGTLTPVPQSPFANGAAPISVAVDGTGRFVYASSGENIAGYTVNARTGSLTPIPGSPFADPPSVYGIAGDRAGRFVYTANYESGQVGGFRINRFTGALTPVPGSPFPAGSGPYTVAVDPLDRFVYVSNSGGSISGYRINKMTGALTPVPGSPFVSSVGGYSLTVEPTGRFLYETNQNGTVLGFQIDWVTGALSTIPGSPFAAELGPFSVAADPSGRFLYVVNAAYAPPALCNVSAYQIDPVSGALTQIPGSPFTAGSESDYIAVDPLGRFAFVANFGDNTIGAFAINPQTGALTPVPDSPFEGGPGPNWIAIDKGAAGFRF
jgi:6-phosphogluconolactonase